MVRAMSRSPRGSEEFGASRPSDCKSFSGGRFDIIATRDRYESRARVGIRRGIGQWSEKMNRRLENFW
jgi:hypothetical protein